MGPGLIAGASNDDPHSQFKPFNLESLDAGVPRPLMAAIPQDRVRGEEAPSMVVFILMAADATVLLVAGIGAELPPRTQVYPARRYCLA